MLVDKGLKSNKYTGIKIIRTSKGIFSYEKVTPNLYMLNMWNFSSYKYKNKVIGATLKAQKYYLQQALSYEHTVALHGPLSMFHLTNQHSDLGHGPLVLAPEPK